MQTSLELQSKKIAGDRRRQRREVREQMDNMLFENETTGLSEEQSERFDVLVEQLESLGPDPKDDPNLGVDLSTNYAELLTGTDKPNRASHRFVDAAGRPILCCAADQNFGTRGDDYQIGEALTGILKGQPLNQQSGSTDSAGGFLLTPELSTRFVDLARANSVCLKAGTPTLNLNPGMFASRN